jgi:hypothetical protein
MTAPRCMDCRHWHGPVVVEGSRRVVGTCKLEGGPVLSSNGPGVQIGDLVYAVWRCDAFERATFAAERTGAVMAEIERQNAALNEKWSSERAVSWSLGEEGPPCRDR